MKLAESDFDVFITVDRNLSYQQHLSKYSIAVIVLRAVSNRCADLAPFADEIKSCLTHLQSGEVKVISLTLPS
jgi:hypothetical protein